MVWLSFSSLFRKRISPPHNVENEDQEGDKRETRPQVVLAVQHFLINIGLGMSMGHSAVLLPQLKEDKNELQIDEDTASWIASVYMLVSPLGCFLGGILLEKIGRRSGVLFGQVVYIAGWTMIATAQSSTIMICGRILDGIGVGIIGSSAAILFDEMAHPRLRVTVLCLASSMLSSGTLVMSSMGAFLHWRTAAALAAAPSVVHMVIVIFMIHETPVYFVKKNKTKQAEHSLYWLWGQRTAKVKLELDDLMARLHKHDMEKSSDQPQVICSKLARLFSNFKEYVQPYILKSFFIIHIFNLLQVPGGMSLLTMYSVDMLNEVQRQEQVIDGTLANIIISALKVILLLISAYLLYRIGRRPIAVISGIGSTIPAIAVGILVYIQVNGNVMSAKAESWINLSLVVVYVAMNTMGFYCLTYTMIGELLPAKVRGFLFGYILALNYLIGGGMAKIYPWMMRVMGIQGIFMLFGISCGICTIFVFLFLPETLGKTLEEIEDYFHQPNIMWISRKRRTVISERL